MQKSQNRISASGVDIIKLLEREESALRNVGSESVLPEARGEKRKK